MISRKKKPLQRTMKSLAQTYKWTFAVGTTSRVPNKPHHHYLILDIDGPIKPVLLEIRSAPKQMFFQKTKNGWHVYSDTVMTVDQMIIALKILGADPVWIEIGRKRGYWFLADKELVLLPWPVERMILKYDKPETRGEKNTRRVR